MKVVEINTEEYNNLVYSEIESGEVTPLGLFIYKYTEDEFFALDSSTGLLFRDTFFNWKDAENWLTGDVPDYEEKRHIAHKVARAIHRIYERKPEDAETVK